MGRKRATKAERDHMERVAALGCIVCREHYGGATPAGIHHLRGHPWSGGGQRASHYDVIPLCGRHHQTGGYGVAYHAGAQAWEERFGTQGELLARVQELLAQSDAVFCAP